MFISICFSQWLILLPPKIFTFLMDHPVCVVYSEFVCGFMAAIRDYPVKNWICGNPVYMWVLAPGIRLNNCLVRRTDYKWNFPNNGWNVQSKSLKEDVTLKLLYVTPQTAEFHHDVTLQLATQGHTKRVEMAHLRSVAQFVRAYEALEVARMWWVRLPRRNKPTS
jgi:hypothetical protein